MTLISLSSFSQIDIKIQQVPNNDTVKLHKDIAKKVAKDLVYLDAIKIERRILLDNIDILKSINTYKDYIIVNKDEQIDKYKGIIKIQEDKEKVYASNISNLKTDLKKQKLAKKLSLGLVLLALGFAVVK
jgi:hypothetical protein